MYILAALVTGIALYLLIVVLFSRIGERQDTLRRRIDTVSSRKNVPFSPDADLNKPFSERFLKPLISSLARKSGKNSDFTEGANSNKNRRESQQKKMLNQAGFSITVAEYGIIKLLVITGLSLLLALITLALSRSAKETLLAAVAGIFFGYAGLRFYLTKTIKKRKSMMEHQLPDMLDLLSVSVEAGLGFEQAINHITNNMEGPLIDELTVTYREMSMGRTRKDALTLLGERCDIEDIKNFVGALIQATQLGISMKNVLRSQATSMRQARRAKVQEKAMKVSVKMLFPMVGLIFPVIFIVLLGPAVVNVLKIFAG